MQETDTRYYSIILPQGRSEKIRCVAQEITTDRSYKGWLNKKISSADVRHIEHFFSKDFLQGTVTRPRVTIVQMQFYYHDAFLYCCSLFLGTLLDVIKAAEFLLIF